jgi:N-acetylmuramoyl-L-alanine amidase
MWRWVTRGLILTLLALSAPLLVAQQFVGDLDAPDPTVTHSGVVLVRGWALNPDPITRIELWVDDAFQHELIMSLPRIDIIEAFPSWPGIHDARPGFVTGFLASRFTNGPHTVEVRVYTTNGELHSVGRRTININNTINQPPFGHLDLPSGGGVDNFSGAFPVTGWAADTDGIERVEVLVDNQIMQGAMYGDPRPDVAATMPDFPAAMFSAFIANVDSTRIQNGVHDLTIRAVDRNGLSRVIGRRTVQVINNNAFLKPFGFVDQPLRDSIMYGTSCAPVDTTPPIISPPSPPVRPTEHIEVIKGWALDLGTRGEFGRVSYVELLVDGVRWLSTDDCGVVEGRFANCYGLTRYDVARHYPTFPDALRSGFLFTLDVGALLNLGVRPGHHRISVRVGDRDQTFAELPSPEGIPVWFQCVDDDFPFLGFGYIEYPAQFDFVAGDVLFRGWALPGDDDDPIVAVEIYVDGLYMGRAQYGYPRPDVADAYPHIDLGLNSGWQFLMDTRKLANSRHRLTVKTVSDEGQTGEIGSVDFYVYNGNPQP